MNLLIYHCKGNAIKSFTQICSVTKSCYLDFLALLHLSFPFLPTFSPVSGVGWGSCFFATKQHPRQASVFGSPHDLLPASSSLPFPSWPLSSLRSSSRLPLVSLPFFIRLPPVPHLFSLPSPSRFPSRIPPVVFAAIHCGAPFLSPVIYNNVCAPTVSSFCQIKRKL